jgi:hypothetical protein
MTQSCGLASPQFPIWIHVCWTLSMHMPWVVQTHLTLQEHQACCSEKQEQGPERLAGVLRATIGTVETSPLGLTALKYVCSGFPLWIPDCRAGVTGVYPS